MASSLRNPVPRRENKNTPDLPCSVVLLSPDIPFLNPSPLDSPFALSLLTSRPALTQRGHVAWISQIHNIKPTALGLAYPTSKGFQEMELLGWPRGRISTQKSVVGEGEEL
jgi:hypothetical protein